MRIPPLRSDSSRSSDIALDNRVIHKFGDPHYQRRLVDLERYGGFIRLPCPFSFPSISIVPRTLILPRPVVIGLKYAVGAHDCGAGGKSGPLCVHQLLYGHFRIINESNGSIYYSSPDYGRNLCGHTTAIPSDPSQEIRESRRQDIRLLAGIIEVGGKIHRFLVLSFSSSSAALFMRASVYRIGSRGSPSIEQSFPVRLWRKPHGEFLHHAHMVS